MDLAPDAVLVASAPFAGHAEPRLATAFQDDAAAGAIEVSLVERARAKDEAALSALYSAHAPAIQRFLRDLLGDPTAAADATQETFARAFRRLDTLREADRVAPWLFGIARNVSLEVRKAGRRYRRVIAPEHALEGRPEGEGRTESRTPEAEMLGREAARVVQAALAKLSEERRAALLLRLDHGLAYEDIATLMSWSLAKVKIEIFRARAALREELEKYQGSRR